MKWLFVIFAALLAADWLTDDANGYVIADAVRIERLVSEEIQLTDAANDVLPDDLGVVDFGTILTLQQPTQTVTINNVGVATLTLPTLPTVSGPFTL